MSNTRRSFLKKSITASAITFLAPTLLSFKNPLKRLNIAVIGVGGRGLANYSRVFESDNIIAMCDVDDKMAANGYKKILEKFPNAKKFKDYRRMFDKLANQIDAVIISTPDHTHFAPAMTAMQLGKHVYMEKPLAHNVWECRVLKKASRYYNIVSQMGNQGHTTNGIREIKEWYDADVLGQVEEVHAWMGQIKYGYYWVKPSSFPAPEEKVPDHLDWNLWLGPRKYRPFNSAYAPRSWRGFYDFGNGQLGDWSCHTLDGPFWALDLGMPTEIEAYVPNPMTKEKFVAEQSVVTYKFPRRKGKKPVTLKWYEGIKPKINPKWGLEEISNHGMIMTGSKKSLMTGGRPNNPKLLVDENEWNYFKNNMPDQKIARLKSGDETPVEEWIDGIKNDFLPLSNFSYGADLTEMALLGVLAQRYGAKIKYDSKNMRITNNNLLNSLLKEEMREGWSFTDF